MSRPGRGDPAQRDRRVRTIRATSGAALHGQIVAAYGRRYLVETAHEQAAGGPGALLSCMALGRQSQYACGDRVTVLSSGPGEGVIESAETRSTLFFRSAAHRSKLIAANATQVAVVVASEPSFSDELVARVLAAAECAGMRSLIVLNKADLAELTTQALERLRGFERAGYPPIVVSALQDGGAMAEALRARLQGETTVLVGQSGMGKSTLINALVPEANAATREISTFLASGKHTTTFARLYRLDAQSAIIDCPGMQEFGLAHLDWRELAAGFREIGPLSVNCRFPDCHHQGEPACAVAAAAEADRIDQRRLALYRRIAQAEFGN